MATETPEKDIAYYLKHPDEVDPKDTQLMQKLIAAESEISGTSAGAAEAKTEEPDKGKEAKTEEPKPGTEAKPAADAKGDKEGAKKPSDEGEEGIDKAEGILTADGKHVIPITVLQRIREESAAAQAALRDMAENYVALEERFKALQAGKAAPAEEKPEQSPEEVAQLLASIEEDAPWAVPHFKRLIEAQNELREQVEQLVGREQAQDADYVEALKVDADKALNENATLLLWKTQAPKLFHEAANVDLFLRKHPEEAQKYERADGSIDFARRYEDCVEIVRARHRSESIPLPEAIKADEKDKGKGETPDPEKVKAQAREKLEKAGEGITTLSDLPGGQPSAESEHESIEKESITALGNRLMAMTPEKLQAWLARNG